MSKMDISQKINVLVVKGGGVCVDDNLLLLNAFEFFYVEIYFLWNRSKELRMTREHEKKSGILIQKYGGVWFFQKCVCYSKNLFKTFIYDHLN